MSKGCFCGSATFASDFDLLKPVQDVDGKWHSEKSCSFETCAFCHEGCWIQTGTAGRLACSNCGSIALDGRQAESVKIGGSDPTGGTPVL